MFTKVEDRLPAIMFARAFEEMIKARAKATFGPVYPAWNSTEMIAVAEDAMQRVITVAKDQRQRTPDEQVNFDDAIRRLTPTEKE